MELPLKLWFIFQFSNRVTGYIPATSEQEARKIGLITAPCIGSNEVDCFNRFADGSILITDFN